MNPPPYEALASVLGRGPAFDAAPIVDRLIRLETPASRQLLLAAISSSPYLSWWDPAVDGLAAHGKVAFETAVAWITRYPRRSHNVILALKRHAPQAAPHVVRLLVALPTSASYDALRMDLVELVAQGQPAGWTGTLSALSRVAALSTAARVAAIHGLGKAIGDRTALAAARLAMGSNETKLKDAGRLAAARLGDRKAAEEMLPLLEKTSATRWREAWIETLAVFPDIDADHLLTSRFPGASSAVQSRVLDLLNDGRRQRGLTYVMEVALSRDHPLRGKALTLMGYRRR
jgi:hypothetical protein